ncbi:substrate-binding periplasmic protein [Thalassolituus sp. LLYu03]|uniref:substrate-binding periplasmic protein n=1 Tax=Thalassolituus sp. LLYu03 TaxID=3421656 RepID=UPI003D287F39
MRIWLLILLIMSGPALADTLRLAVGQSLPPYIMADGTGMELDIVREALALRGYDIEPVFMPFQRVVDSVRQGQTEGALTVNEDSGLKAFYSAEHIRYQNVAIALAKRRLPVHEVRDLAGYSVLAFQNARHYLGPAFGAMAAANPEYHELAQQQLQIAMLLNERVDVIVLDQNIFTYFRHARAAPVTDAGIEIFTLFPPTPYKVAFREAVWRDAFNSGLAELRANGRYDAILHSYLSPDTRSEQP